MQEEVEKDEFVPLEEYVSVFYNMLEYYKNKVKKTSNEIKEIEEKTKE